MTKQGYMGLSLTEKVRDPLEEIRISKGNRSAKETVEKLIWEAYSRLKDAVFGILSRNLRTTGAR